MSSYESIVYSQWYYQSIRLILWALMFWQDRFPGK